MHTRKQIRDKIKQLLAADPELTSVYTGRMQSTHTERMPYAYVQTGTETSERHVDQYREVRTVQVYIRLYAAADEHLDDTLDNLAETVEALLGHDQTLGGLVETWDYKGVEPDAASASSVEKGSLSLKYECKYLWSPTAAVDNFSTAVAQIDLSSPRNDPPIPPAPDGQIDAVTTITIPV